MPNKEQQRLKDAIADVRKTFFPRWDKDNQWVIAVNENILESCGVCNNDTKTIYLKYVQEDRDKLYLLLIHEICHAIVGPGHNKKFYSRMLKSAKLAKHIGQASLSKEIKGNVAIYENTPKIKAADVYQYIENQVENSIEFGELSYEAFIEIPAVHYCMSVDEFEHRYPRCKKVFEKAKRFYKELLNER